MTGRDDLAVCRRLLADGSRTFLAASHLLPRRVRDDAVALYAFCRVADDAIDGVDATDVPRALAALRDRLDGVYGGVPSPRATASGGHREPDAGTLDRRDGAGTRRRIDDAGTRHRVDDAGTHRRIDDGGTRHRVDDAGTHRRIDDGGTRHGVDGAGTGRRVDDAGTLDRDAAVDRAFAAVVRRTSLPRALPEALLDGFAWDAAGRRYRTLGELQDYAARVAGSVGAMMAVLMGARSAEALARACDLGVAMQLSNIARDVGEDARAGRLYLPLDGLARAGIDAEAWLAAPAFDARIGDLACRLVDHAEALYARAATGIAALPRDCRFGIRTALALYREIGREVRRRGGDSIGSRAVVAPTRKLGVLARALVVPARRAPLRSAPLAATRFLVEAATAPSPPSSRRGSRVVGLIELFERLERQDRRPYLGAARASTRS